MSRFDFIKYDNIAQARHDMLKDLIEELAECIVELTPSRESALAMTNLEQSFMWMGKAIKEDQKKRQEDTEKVGYDV